MHKNAAIANTVEEHFSSYKIGEIYKHAIDDTEKVLIEKALERSFGNQLLAAKILGINRNTMRAKIQKFKINITKYTI